MNQYFISNNSLVCGYAIGFPDGSDSKESAFKARDPGLGRFPGEGNGYPTVFLPGKFFGQRS